MTAEQSESLAATRDLEPSPKNIQRVAAKLGPDLARWGFTQWELRQRATSKFSRAEDMLFTRDGLEMASHETVAAFHAYLYDPARIVDLTCGIGADLIAFGRNWWDGRPIGLDIDAAHVACANHNLRVHGVPGRALVADARHFTVRTPSKKLVSIFLDPQRRTSRGRTTDPGLFQPRLDEVLPQVQGAYDTVIKLSPMLDDAFLESLGGRVWFVSHAGQCCEALVLIGDVENFGHGGAVRAHDRTWLGSCMLKSTHETPLDYVHEADPAAIRGHCLGQFDRPGLGDSNGYLTSNNPSHSPWLRDFRVLWEGPWRQDRVATALEGNGGRLTAVKVRGLDVNTDQTLRSLRGGKGNGLVLILYPVGKAARAILAEPIPGESPP